MNRQQRRAAERALPAYRRGTKEEKLAKLMKQGISPADLRAEFESGFEQGVRQGIEMTTKTLYAGVMIALKRKYGFGRRRAMRVLLELDSLTTEYLTTTEIIDDVYKEFGVTLDFKDPLEHIKEA